VKLVLLSVGKVKDERMAGLIRDYLRRLQGAAQVKWEVVKAAGSGLSAQEAVRVEGQKLLERLNQDDVVVLLDERGVQWTSPKLAQWLEKQRSAAKRIVFVVGGPWGTSVELQRRADVVLSLSPFTLQHDLALLVLAEQLYRAFSILSGHPYHK